MSRHPTPFSHPAELKALTRRLLVVCIHLTQGNWMSADIMVFTDHTGTWQHVLHERRVDGWLAAHPRDLIEIANVGEFYAGTCVKHDSDVYRWSGDAFVYTHSLERWIGEPGVSCP